MAAGGAGAAPAGVPLKLLCPRSKEPFAAFAAFRADVAPLLAAAAASAALAALLFVGLLAPLLPATLAAPMLLGAANPPELAAAGVGAAGVAGAAAALELTLDSGAVVLPEGFLAAWLE